jgi:hypothetical protein
MRKYTQKQQDNPLFNRFLRGFIQVKTTLLPQGFDHHSLDHKHQLGLKASPKVATV